MIETLKTFSSEKTMNTMGTLKTLLSEKTLNTMKTLSSEKTRGYDGNMDSFLTFLIFALSLGKQNFQLGNKI